MQQDEGPSSLIVRVDDSPDARLFIELSSFGSDLAEARHALDLAVGANDDGSPLIDAIPYLIGFAVVAYCRTLQHSKVRRRLTHHLEIPEDLTAINDAIKSFRNATIAHSQSDLSVTYPVGVLDPVSLQVQFVAATTIINPLPWSVVQQFSELVSAVEGLLDTAIAPVRARLEAELMKADRSALVAAGAKPEVQHHLAGRFKPNTKRPKYPTSHPFYWSELTRGD